MMTKIEEARAIDHDPQWKYRTSDNKEQNFQRWWRWNNDERKKCQQPLYEEKKAREVFEIKFTNLDEDDYEA